MNFFLDHDQLLLLAAFHPNLIDHAIKVINLIIPSKEIISAPAPGVVLSGLISVGSINDKN